MILNARFTDTNGIWLIQKDRRGKGVLAIPFNVFHGGSLGSPSRSNYTPFAF